MQNGLGISIGTIDTETLLFNIPINMRAIGFAERCIAIKV
jgi:hypothetical protein